jgi:hypothetical protein
MSFQWLTPDLTFRLGVLSKNYWAYQFVSLLISLAISGVIKNSQYSNEVLVFSKSMFRSDLPLNGKMITQLLTLSMCHVPCHSHHWHYLYHQSWLFIDCLTELSFRSLSPLDSLSEISLHSFSYSTSHNTSSSLTCILFLGPAIMLTQTQVCFQSLSTSFNTQTYLEGLINTLHIVTR